MCKKKVQACTQMRKTNTKFDKMGEKCGRMRSADSPHPCNPPTPEGQPGQSSQGRSQGTPVAIQRTGPGSPQANPASSILTAPQPWGQPRQSSRGRSKRTLVAIQRTGPGSPQTTPASSIPATLQPWKKHPRPICIFEKRKKPTNTAAWLAMGGATAGGGGGGAGTRHG